MTPATEKRIRDKVTKWIMKNGLKIGGKNYSFKHKDRVEFAIKEAIKMWEEAAPKERKKLGL